jgi:hypothetical protein
MLAQEAAVPVSLATPLFAHVTIAIAVCVHCCCLFAAVVCLLLLFVCCCCLFAAVVSPPVMT